MGNIFRNYSGFNGRLNRQPFWISAIVLAVISAIISLVILPVIGLSMFPNMAALTGGTLTASEIGALAADATRKGAWVGLVMFIVFLYPSAAICIKRRHDRNSSGLDVWIYFGLTAILLLVQALGLGITMTDLGNGVTMPLPSVPISIFSGLIGIYGIYLLVVLGFLKGTAGTNSYGPDPLQG